MLIKEFGADLSAPEVERKRSTRWRRSSWIEQIEALIAFPTARRTDEARNVKITAYFRTVRSRPDRAIIQDEWIERVIAAPERERVQADGRIRLWAQIDEMKGRRLRVILLPDRETVRNAFFDRGFKL